MAATEAQITEFVTTLGNLAVAECNRRIAAGKGFILPSICIAQSALETGYGTADIMVKANAYFGIKAGGSWTGAVFVADTKEVINGEWVNTTANFRAYDSLADSVADYYELTTEASRYSEAVSYGNVKSAWKTPEETINALWAAGYATDDEYGPLIMSMVNGRGFDAYDAKITGVDDGSAGGGTGGGSAPTVTIVPTLLFNKRDMVQGSLITIDSARAITNLITDVNAVALKWENAVSVPITTSFNIKGLPSGYVLNVAYTTNTSATITPYDVTVPVVIAANNRWGFYLTRSDGGAVSLSDLPDSFELALVNSSIPGAVYNAGPIAKFVKI